MMRTINWDVNQRLSMVFLVHPFIPVCKKEYLYDSEKGHELIGIWISVKSTKYKALYIQTLLTDYGALFDKSLVRLFGKKILTKITHYSLMYYNFGTVLIMI